MKGKDVFPGNTLVCTNETSTHTQGALSDCPSATHRLQPKTSELLIPGSQERGRKVTAFNWFSSK